MNGRRSQEKWWYHNAWWKSHKRFISVLLEAFGGKNCQPTGSTRLEPSFFFKCYLSFLSFLLVLLFALLVLPAELTWPCNQSHSHLRLQWTAACSRFGGMKSVLVLDLSEHQPLKHFMHDISPCSWTYKAHASRKHNDPLQTWGKTCYPEGDEQRRTVATGDHATHLAVFK